MVWYTSLIATPCLSTLSRSTLMYSSGTLGINVVATKPISGRLRAAAKNLAVLSARNPDTRNRRRRETEDSSLRQTAEFLVQTSFYFLILFRSAFALAPGFQRNEEETVVASVREAEQVETHNRCCVLNSRHVSENVLYLLRSFACTFHGSRDRKLHGDVEVALVFIGHKARGQPATKEKRTQTEDCQQHQHERALANHRMRPADKPIRTAFPITIEGAKEFPERSAMQVGVLFGSWPQQQTGQCRAKSERVEG